MILQFLHCTITKPYPSPDASIAVCTSFAPSIWSHAADCSPFGESETSTFASPSNLSLAGKPVLDTTVLIPMLFASANMASTMLLLFSPLISRTISFSGARDTLEYLHHALDAAL